ncbi:LRR receptor-like serine/threonine-protein kinase GSO2 [Prunus yedoensis var. nudiflora]|uniref:LRR receptor-like serine/threonine-protein kinase GSO2 n=1 Tax=Prunus yedoensis var. nudiflora TaxID=2094558 RepID=A0A314UMU5_PRUYE|nr:LRR receptor-like serine/threonine-protein kinase GSO2 [Prunus yedoensis var. nudiflora]
MVGVRCCFKLLYEIVVVILLHMNNPCIGCSERERQALLALKQGLVADDRDPFLSWGREAQNKDCCEWDGVYCSNQTGHVVKLDVGHQSLRGKISPKLIELQHLEYLDLSGNNFSGTQIPDFIGSLSNLRYLDLSHANFGGLIPYQLGNLRNLHYLDLNYPSGSIYAKNLYWLPNLSRLKYLDLSFVNLSSDVGWLEAVNMLPKLTNLTLQICNLPPPVISSVSLLNSSKSLVHVDLYKNNLNSSIFQWLPGTHTNLVYLRLSKNKLSGRIPESIGQMSNLEFINLRKNSLEGVISETYFSKLSKLRYLDLSFNSLVLNFSFDWVPPFQLHQIRLGSCKMGPYFPKWLRTQKSYDWLDISDAGISDTIPSWFWDLQNKLVYKDLSRNQIRGNLRSELASNYLNVSWNQLEGPIPSILPNVSILDLSNNKFSGSASFLCTSTTEESNLTNLDLSSNHVSGELPDCWIHFRQLVFLDLSDNSLSGKIPTTMGYLFSIETLKLNNNRFVGELPSQLKNCRNLILVDVGENKLSGLIPKWLGENLLNLAIIILRSNQFYRIIPPQLCHLTQLQILDLSMNNISGTIPKCLNTWTTLAQNGHSSPRIKHPTIFQWRESFYDLPYDDEASLTWKGVRSKYKSILGLVKSIDLSCNKLSGEIPTEITYLVGLVSLNLSRNRLTGQIPSRIGNLQELDSLDLSRNQINGRIPISISRINRIGYLDLSENNLSGKIPISTQLQTFDSAYGGNPLLCGEPLPRTCSEEEKGPGQTVLVNEDDKDGLITQGFYISMGLGFAVGFWGVCGTLLLNRSCRYTYFNFLTFLNDWLYMKAEIIRQRILNK